MKRKPKTPAPSVSAAIVRTHATPLHPKVKPGARVGGKQVGTSAIKKRP